jgi:hypothetical protein
MRSRYIPAVVLAITLTGAVNAADRPPAPIVNVPYVDQQTWAAGLREFGTATLSTTPIPAAAFRPEYSTGKFSWIDAGYIGPDSDSDSGYLWAPVTLPSGAKVCWMNAFVQDTNSGANANVSVYLYRTTGGAGSSPGVELLASTQSSGSAGYGYIHAAVAPDYIGQPACHTISNYASTDANGGQYFVEVFFGDTTGLAIRGVELRWQRQISPAPATATFTDVPTTHLFFQQVEAMKASGITTGINATTFGPDQNVTRGQMAAFLARALGLHWEQ